MWQETELMPGMTVGMALTNIASMPGASQDIKDLCTACKGHPLSGPPTKCGTLDDHKLKVQGAMNGAGNSDWGVVKSALEHGHMG